MPTVALPIPINGYSDSLNHQHGADGFSTSMMNVIPIDNWEHRRRVGTRQGFAALADLGENDDYNVQELLTYDVYRDTNMLNEVLIVSGSSGPVAATATVTFTGNVTLNRTITITDTAGTTVVYTAKASTTVADNEFKRDGTVTEIADALELCIENSAGHNGTISASNVLGVLTLTQVSEGTGGNNTITFDLDSTTVSGFISGDDNSGVFYVDSSGNTNDILYSVAAATATVTFTDVPTVDQTIIMTDTAGTSKTYTAKLVETLASNEFTIGGVAATATITFTDAPAVDDTITIIDTYGTSKTYTAKSGETLASGYFNRDGDTTATAQSLEDCIEHASGHNGTITCASPSNVLTLTQVGLGTGGNTTIATSGGIVNTTVVSFGGDSTVVVGANTAAATATSLTACINDASGHGATITAVATDKVVALTQDVLGTATSTGNTDITSTLSNATATNFSGAAYAAGTGRIQKYDGVRAVQFGDTAYLVTGRHYYKIVLSATTPVIEEWTNYNGSGGMPTDDVGNKCTLITIFGARIVMSGLSSSRNNWFMSKIGDAEDWTPTALSSSDAQAGDSSTNFGKLGEPITAIFPFGESGLMMAGRNTLTFLTADPVISGAKFAKMSNGVGVMGADAWCQGPEKSCYVASRDGVYLIQPNDFNIQRGQSITAGRLDGFFSGVNPSEVDLHLAYDPPRSTIVMFVNREDDPANVIHYQHHMPTQSWWTFKIYDPTMDVIRATCLYSPISGERAGLWVGCKSGRIATQPNSGNLSYDGGSHISPLRATTNNSPNDNKVAITSRLAWSPINAGLSNERLLMTEIDVLLDTHAITSTEGITPVGPTLTLYGADTAQTLSGVSGDILVTETELVIDGGVGAFVADDPSTSFDCGNADTKAYAIISVADGDATDHGIAELQYITLTDNEATPVTKTYVVVDDTLTSVSTGDVLVEGSDYGSAGLTAGHDLIGGIAVSMNTTGSIDTSHEFLTQLKAAIEHTAGHDDTIVVSDVTSGDGSTATIIGNAALDDEDGTDFILRNADGSTVTFTTDPTLNQADVSADIGDTAATATIVGTGALAGEDGTDFILTNADDSTVTFHTDPTKGFGDTSDDGGDHTWILNTGGDFSSDEIRKATQALWIACNTAIVAGELDMTIVPTTVDPIASGQEYFTLTQTTTGTAGNKAITLVTGVTANGETNFTGGFDGQRWRVNTRDIEGGSEVRKATQAIHIACLAAIAAGELDMTAVPSTDTGSQTSFTLTQTTFGTVGDTAITLVTGVTADGETAFAGGGTAAGTSITLTQETAFRGGNTPITETIASSVTIPSVFVGGQTTAVGTEYIPAIEATIQLHEATISTLNGQVIVLNDLASGTSAVTLTFDSSIGVNASTATKIGCEDADENYLSIMKAVKKSIDLNYVAGLLNLRTEEPTLYAADEARMVIRTSDNWNGIDLLTGLTLTGTAVSNNYIEGEAFALQGGTNWKQFINGGKGASDVAGLYSLNDSAASESLRKWSILGTYTVRKGGNTSVPEPPQFSDRWGVFGIGDGVTVPMYLAEEETATLSLSTWSSTEILPSGFTASAVLVDPQQDTTTKRELATFALNKGRNNRFRLRKRESDFQIQISATGTTWVLEDIAANIEQGGPYRSVVTA